MTDNPFATLDLFMPKVLHEHVKSLVGIGAQDPAPFRRQIDAWWTGLCIGVALGTRTPMSGESVKFNDASILGTDPWRITHLQLIALAEEGVEVLASPVKVVGLAQEYANAGLAWISDGLLGESEPVLALTRKLDQFHSAAMS